MLGIFKPKPSLLKPATRLNKLSQALAALTLAAVGTFIVLQIFAATGPRRIVFVDQDYRALQTIRDDGAGLKTIYTAPPGKTVGLPKWSADHQYITFTLGAQSGTSHIAIIKADGTSFKQVTSGNVYDTRPVWAPHGLSLAFIRDSVGPTGLLVQALMVVNVDGNGLRQVRQNHLVNHPEWSPDGNRIVYSESSSPSRGLPGQTSLFTIRPNGSDQRFISDLGNSLTPAKWFADSRRVLYEQSNGQTSILFTANFDGSNPRPLIWNAKLGYGRSLSALNLVAYTWRDNLHTISSAGSNYQQLVTGRVEDRSAAWSPGASKIAFVRRNSAGQAGINVISSDGATHKRVYTSSSSSNPSGIWLDW